MIILAVETSCDETGVALIRGTGNRQHPHLEVLVNLLASQVEIHKKYGGVVPRLAAREHEKNLPILLKRAVRQAKQKNIALEDIDFIAVTKGPGLAPALWRGINFAKDLAQKMDKPLIGVDHMQGHIAANFIRQSADEVGGDSKFIFPALALVVSGGHTELVLLKKMGNYELLGETLDDAAGEAFDKVARMLGLPYPGGPEISKLAQKGDPAAFAFPRPMLAQKNYSFSFSGLKTAVLYTLRDLPKKPTAKTKRDIAASFEQAVVDTLAVKTLRAVKNYQAKTLFVAGGVAANKKLRETLEQKLGEQFPNVYFHAPTPSLCTDNAAMIGAAAYLQRSSTKKSVEHADSIQAEPSRQIADP